MFASRVPVPKVAARADAFAEGWLRALQEVSGPEDRIQAFGGLLAMAQHNWHALVASRSHRLSTVTVSVAVCPFPTGMNAALSFLSLPLHPALP